MSAPELSGEPSGKVSAGDTLKWRKSFADYPASAGWTLTYYFRAEKGTATITPVVASADGDEFTVTVSAADSALWPIGTLHWSARLSLAGENVSAGSGSFLVLADPASVSDTRSHSQKMIDALEEYLEKHAGTNIITRSLANLGITRINPEQARAMLQQYRAERAAEVAKASGKPNRRYIKTQFV